VRGSPVVRTVSRLSGDTRDLSFGSGASVSRCHNTGDRGDTNREVGDIVSSSRQ
jgi:hypothetical protein